MDPLEINWNKIAFELEEELGRKPVTKEIQEKLMQKYWAMVDAIENDRRRGNISDI
jgi:hypothetical protein